jgi:hypothetical protein
MKNTLYLGVSLFLIIAIRNQIDYSNTTLDNLKSYTFAEEWKKTYGNLGDFYEFITQSREAIGIKREIKNVEFTISVHKNDHFVYICG